jgi:hypothetical protein
MAAQLVADIIKQKVEEIKEEKFQRLQAVLLKRRRSKLWYFLGLLPLFLLLTIWNLVRSGEEPRVFSSEELVAGTRFKMYLTAQAVQAYRDSAGRWPRNLAAVGLARERLVYQLVDGTYTITDTSGSVPLVYRGGESLTLFANAYAVLARRRRN